MKDLAVYTICVACGVTAILVVVSIQPFDNPWYLTALQLLSAAGLLYGIQGVAKYW